MNAFLLRQRIKWGCQIPSLSNDLPQALGKNNSKGMKTSLSPQRKKGPQNPTTDKGAQLRGKCQNNWISGKNILRDQSFLYTKS